MFGSYWILKKIDDAYVVELLEDMTIGPAFDVVDLVLVSRRLLGLKTGSFIRFM